MNKRNALLVVLAVASVAVWRLGTREHDDREVAPATEEPLATRASGSSVPDARAAHADALPAPADFTEPQPTSEVITADPERVFQTTDAGELQIDEQTRLRVEALFALTNPTQLAQAKQRAVEHLPPAAATQAADLLSNYDNYRQAQRQAYPPGSMPPTAEAAIAELDGLHALRAAHFGDRVAEALYGAEERRARSMVESLSTLAR